LQKSILGALSRDVEEVCGVHVWTRSGLALHVEVDGLLRPAEVVKLIKTLDTIPHLPSAPAFYTKWLPSAELVKLGDVGVAEVKIDSAGKFDDLTDELKGKLKAGWWLKEVKVWTASSYGRTGAVEGIEFVYTNGTALWSPGRHYISVPDRQPVERVVRLMKPEQFLRAITITPQWSEIGTVRVELGELPHKGSSRTTDVGTRQMMRPEWFTVCGGNELYDGYEENPLNTPEPRDVAVALYGVILPGAIGRLGLWAARNSSPISKEQEALQIQRREAALAFARRPRSFW